MNEYLDCLIPRGSHGLIQAVVQNANVPVIQTGDGMTICILRNQQIWIWRKYLINAKISVLLHAMIETLVIDEEFAGLHLAEILQPERFK